MQFFVYIFSLVLCVCCEEGLCSKYICRNTTKDNGNTFISYFGGSIRENFFLNSTEITNTTAKNTSFCVKACTFANGCFSINAGKRKQDDNHVECLIRGNMYTNKSMLIEKTNWTHISIKV